MSVMFKLFDKETLSDVEKVVKRVFSDGACKGLANIVACPYEEVADVGCGEVVYEDETPIAFHGAILRKYYYRQGEFSVVSGSTLGIVPEARDSSLAIRILKKTQFSPRANSRMFVGNTINETRVKLNKMFHVKGVGPSSCAEKRLGVVSRLRFGRYLFLRKILKRTDSVGVEVKTCSAAFACGKYEIRLLPRIDAVSFDSFFEEYLEKNEGVVASRRFKDLNWIFGERLSKGEVLLFGLYEKEKLRGYAFVGLDAQDGSAAIKDVIVCDNNLNLLTSLLRGVIRGLGKYTSVSHCQITGYADYAQNAIAENFPIRRALVNNQYCYSFQKSNPIDFDQSVLNSPKSWFFGAYDGDACMF